MFEQDSFLQPSVEDFHVYLAILGGQEQKIFSLPLRQNVPILSALSLVQIRMGELYLLSQAVRVIRCHWSQDGWDHRTQAIGFWVGSGEGWVRLPSRVVDLRAKAFIHRLVQDSIIRKEVPNSH